MMALVIEGPQRRAESLLLLPGTQVSVRMCRGRLATRTGTILAVHGFEGSVHGRQVSVRWDDDGSVSWLRPGPDIEIVTLGSAGY